MVDLVQELSLAEGRYPLSPEGLQLLLHGRQKRLQSAGESRFVQTETDHARQQCVGLGRWSERGFLRSLRFDAHEEFQGLSRHAHQLKDFALGAHVEVGPVVEISGQALRLEVVWTEEFGKEPHPGPVDQRDVDRPDQWLDHPWKYFLGYAVGIDGDIQGGDLAQLNPIEDVAVVHPLEIHSLAVGPGDGFGLAYHLFDQLDPDLCLSRFLGPVSPFVDPPIGGNAILDQGLAAPLHGLHDDFVQACHRVLAEGHAGCVWRDHLLDDDRHSQFPRINSVLLEV